MKAAPIAVVARVYAHARLAVPPNCETLASSYIGDWFCGVLRSHDGRDWFFITPDGIHRLDPHELIAAYVQAIQEWNRELGFTTGRPAARAARSDGARARGRARRRRDHPRVAAHGETAPRAVRRVAAASGRAGVDARAPRSRRSARG